MISWSEHDGLATATLTRPRQRNALDADACRDLAEQLHRFDGGPVIVSGAAGTFSAGADLAAYTSRAAIVEFSTAFEELLAAVGSCRWPVIAAVDGHAVGAGCILALTCDLRVGSARARFAVPAARLGFVLPVEQVRRIAAAAGPASARQLLLGGDTISGELALARGLLHRLTADPQAEAGRWAGELAGMSAGSLAGHKQILRWLECSAGPAPDRLRAAVDDALAGPELAEGLRAFRDGRRPVFGPMGAS